MSESADLSAVGYVVQPLVRCRVDFHDMAKSSSGSTEPSLAGRSRTWPKDASTLYSGAEILVDRFCLRRRFHYHYIHKIARTRPGLSAGRANSRRTDLAHEMYIEIDAVKPNGRFTSISQPEYNQCAIATVLQFKIIKLS
jgi:hypothetical protein